MAAERWFAVDALPGEASHITSHNHHYFKTFHFSLSLLKRLQLELFPYTFILHSSPTFLHLAMKLFVVWSKMCVARSPR